MKILIVGASRGLGLEFVRQYRAEGHSVVATARDGDGAARIEALGARSLMLDVIDMGSVKAFGLQLSGSAFDVAIVNAGIAGNRLPGLEPPSQADFDAVMHTNVLGPMRVIEQLIPTFSTSGAKLIVMSSRMGSMSLRDNAAAWLYRASKAAVNSVLKDASTVLKGRVTCVAMHPGWVRTDMGGSGADLSVEQSVSDMRATIAALGTSDSGGFVNHDGTALSW